MSTFLAIWLVAGGAPGVASAQEDFAGSLQVTRRLFESQEYEKALERLEQARPLARSEEQRTAVALYEGLALASLGRRQQARAVSAFRTALELAPRVRLPVRAVAQVERDFEEVRVRVLEELARRPPSLEDAGPPGAPERPFSEAFALRASEERGAHPGVVTSAILGGGLIVSGGVLLGLARNEQSKLRNNDPRLATSEDAQRTALRGQRYQTVGWSLLGAGAVGVAVATSLQLLRAPEVPVTLGVGTSGTSVLLQGRWP